MMMTKMNKFLKTYYVHTRAYREGKAAYMVGKKSDENPYPQVPLDSEHMVSDFTEWRLGYLHGATDEESEAKNAREKE